MAQDRLHDDGEAPGTRRGPGDAPAHVPEKAQQNLDLLKSFEDSADEDASKAQLLIERATNVFGSPTYLAVVILFCACWIGVASWGRRAGWPHMESPPFFWLQGLVGFNSLLLTVAVLIRQRRMSELADHRAHLDLQINLLTEQKVTKILQLLSESAGAAAAEPGSPSIDDLRKPVDPKALLDAIKRSTSDG